jgi:hypothetical protein
MAGTTHRSDALGDPLLERVVVRLPLSVPTVIRLLGALGQEFPGVRLVGDPAGADLVFEVPVDDGPRGRR